MRKCEKCGFTTENGNMKFCVKCGNKMTEISDTASPYTNSGNVCPKCGYANKDNTNFCIKCGTSLNVKGVDLSKGAAPLHETVREKTAAADPDIISDPVSEKGRGRIIAVCAAAAAVIAAAAIAFVILGNKETRPAEEELAVSDTESVSETAEETEETSETTAETTAETVSSTTEAAETAAAETETTAAETEPQPQPKAAGGEIIPTGDDPVVYTFSCGDLSFSVNNRFYKFEQMGMEYYSNYYSFFPSVTVNGNEIAANNIENSLNSVLQIQYQNSEDTDAFEMNEEPDSSMGSMVFKNSIKCVTEDNGLLFVTIDDYEDYGGGSYFSRFLTEQTFIFDIETGFSYSLSDLVTDSPSFTKAIDDYIRDMVYDNSYHSAENEAYELSEEMGFDAFDESLKENPWFEYNTDWRYEGSDLIIKYSFLVGSSGVDKSTSFSVPKSVWGDYVDF